MGKDDREGRGGEGHLGTYQRSHPLEEVDAFPVVDVVRLPALGGTRKGEQSGACPPRPHLSGAPSGHWGVMANPWPWAQAWAIPFQFWD